jgi:hypothetical protein
MLGAAVVAVERRQEVVARIDGAEPTRAGMRRELALGLHTLDLRAYDEPAAPMLAP